MARATTATLAAVDAWIDTQPAAWRGTLRSARAFLHDALPGTREAIKWGYPTWVGNRNIASLMVFPDHVNLQIFQGALLSDPKGLLEGTGAAMRHVKIHHAKDLQVPAVKSLLRTAARMDAERGPGAARVRGT